MDGLKEKTGNLGKSIFKKMIIPILILFIVITMLMGSIYSIFEGNIRDFVKAQQDYKNLLNMSENGVSRSKNNQTLKVSDIQLATIKTNERRYSRIASMEETSLQIVSDQNYSLSKEIIIAQQKVADIIDGGINGTKVAAKTKAEEIAGGLSFLGDYIKDSPTQTKEQKLAYLMNSEVVTMFPYLASIDGDETKLNGTIRFYRYLNSVEDGESEAPTEKIQLTFINKDGFNAKFEEYKNSGNQDVLKYFTLDEDQNVVIAYGTIETKTITTTDNELTLDKINEMSTQTYTKKGDGVYESKTYTVATKPIDYQSYVEQYVLPFSFLATILVQTRDYNLVKEIADLAYESELAIGIYDNKSITENTEEYTYNKKIKYTENTQLVFDNINTDPKVNISSSRYSQVIKECFGKLNDTKENSIHTSGIKLEDLETATGNRTDGKVYEAYISSISEEGIVTGITSSPYEFKTTFNIKTIANSAPTVDIAIADIWAGKYTSTYIKEENNISPETSTYSLEDEEFVKIDTNKFAQNILKEDGEIGKNLKSHSENLRKLAIGKIIEKTDFTVSPRAMTVDDISSHAESCDDCKEELEAKYGESWQDEITTNENVLNEVKTLEELATVKEHVEEELRKEAENKTEERKQKFINDINKPGQITYKQWPTAYKSNISIANTKTSSKITSTYQKDTTKTENLGEKFASIFQDDKFYESRQAILEREEWVWEALKKDESTAKIENLIRYLFNIAFETQEFGEFSQEDIEKLFEIFEPEEHMEEISYHESNLLQQYVRMFENSYLYNYIYGETNNYTNSVAQYITQDKTAYYVNTDGYGNPTVGFGVDLFNGGFYDEGLGKSISFAEYLIEYYGYTEAQLKDASGNTTIPVEIIDELEEKVLQQKLNDIREMNEKEKLNLNKYQIYALVSFSFNTGKMYKSGSYNKFIELYNQYWNVDSDDKYGQEESSVDYEQILYTEFFYKSRFTKNAAGELVEVPGLVNRRKSEWILFQTGYMNNINQWVIDQDYPDGIRTFEVNGQLFPEYPQKRKVGDTSLYANERFGYPAANKTLGSSGCGVFSMSMILSGLLEDASIDPITLRDAMERDSRIGYSYHAWDPVSKTSSGSLWYVLCNEEFLQETYGVKREKTWPDYNTGINALNEGKCILAIEPGHYVAVIPVPDELQGQGYEFFVLDSARGHTGAYKSMQDFIERTGQSYLNFLAIIAK